MQKYGSKSNIQYQYKTKPVIGLITGFVCCDILCQLIFSLAMKEPAIFLLPAWAGH